MSLDDERVRFYIRHREQIEQWAMLRTEAAAAMDDWLAGLEPEIEAMARERGPDVLVRRNSDPAFPVILLERDGWGRGSATDLLGVGLGWARGKTSLRGQGLPYVGLFAGKTPGLGEAVRASEEVRRARVARKETSSQWWAAYAYIPPPSSFPDEVEPYREVLLNTLRTAWETYDPIVSTLVAKP